MATTVSNIDDLNTAIYAATFAGSPGTITISLGADIALSGTALEAFNLAPGVTVDLVGNGHTLDGGGSQRGLFVYAGAVSVEDLSINGKLAAGGTGTGGGRGVAGRRDSSGGGGGGGYGGGGGCDNGRRVNTGAISLWQAR